MNSKRSRALEVALGARERVDGDRRRCWRARGNRRDFVAAAPRRSRRMTTPSRRDFDIVTYMRVCREFEEMVSRAQE